MWISAEWKVPEPRMRCQLSNTNAGSSRNDFTCQKVMTTRKISGAAKNTACHATTGTPSTSGSTAGEPAVRARWGGVPAGMKLTSGL